MRKLRMPKTGVPRDTIFRCRAFSLIITRMPKFAGGETGFSSSPCSAVRKVCLSLFPLMCSVFWANKMLPKASKHAMGCNGLMQSEREKGGR